MSGLSALVAAGDVDALRLELQRLQSGGGASNGSCASSSDAPDPAEALASKGIAIADRLLALGLPHLERAEKAAEATAEGSRTTEFHLVEFSLTLRSVSVMGQTVWPAAIALSRWLTVRAPSHTHKPNRGPA